MSDHTCSLYCERPACVLAQRDELRARIEADTMLQEVQFVRSKKQHLCRECFRRIETGESYHREIYVFDGHFTVHKTCAHCMVVRNWLSDECGGWMYGGIEEDAREHVHNNRGWYGIDLYRAVVGMQWKWRTPSGRLLPVPKPIATSEENQSKRLGQTA